MATPVKTIEKEYLLRVLYDEDIPIIFYRDGAEYAFFLSKPIRDEIVLQSRQPVDIIKVKDRLELTFEFR
ncbi:MAG: PilZ domain-containing protein, partial [Treponema sp.]|nr:PilZ domain-containing protein [Treponema sp.]